VPSSRRGSPTLRHAQNFFDRIVLEINAFVLRWVDGAARAAVTDLGIGEMAFGIGLCIAGKGRQSAQPSSHKKQRKIALRDLVAGNNERGQFLGREILHFIEKNFQRHTALVRSFTYSYQYRASPVRDFR
jgi:hypothetical protein